MKSLPENRRNRVMDGSLFGVAAEALTRVMLGRPRAKAGERNRALEDLERRIRQRQTRVADNLLVLYLDRPASDVDELCIALKSAITALRESPPTVLPFHDVRDILRAEDLANDEADRAEREVMAEPTSLQAVATCVERSRKHITLLTRAHDVLVAVQVRLQSQSEPQRNWR